MSETVGLLPTSIVGSYASPSWLWSALEDIRQGRYGEGDIRETLEDAVQMAVRDQEAAGVDILTDGEMRRLDFVMGFYDRLSGLLPLELPRKMGAPGHDQRPKWKMTGPLQAPEGLGVVEEYRYLRGQTARPVKMTCPGPYTLSGRLTGGVCRDRMECAYALASIVNQELKVLAANGADFIQLDEPSYAVYPDRPREFIELFNATVEDVEAKIGLHLCFGNYRGRPVGKRVYRPLFPYILEARADQLVLEFANREMAEIDLWQEFPSDKELAAGLVDVKNYYIETPEDVAERIRLALRYVPAGKLSIVPDCGFSQTARWASFAKLKAMVEGARIVRRELGEQDGLKGTLDCEDRVAKTRRNDES
ncbi:MAG: methionine synthase [Armatimonadetes bacterium]|nr:methionine synthase [Armatimonadota bacterium]